MVLVFNLTFSQVGIGTTSPQAQLDIRSSNLSNPANNDGILIPKMDEFPATNPTASQDGMMVFATGNGSVTKGFYYWDNTAGDWIPVISGNTPDHDWYEQSTTVAPDNINDNIYHMGRVGIGQNTANAVVDIYTTSNAFPTLRAQKTTGPTTGLSVGIDHTLYTENSNGDHYGFRNYLVHPVTSFQTYGFYNRISGVGPNTGYHNYFETLGGGDQIGFRNYGFNTLTGSNHDTYGLRNNFTDNSQGDLFGLDNYLVKNSTSGSIIGINSIIASNRDVTGVYNGFNSSGGATVFGFRSRFDGNGNGPIYGTYNSIFNTGSGPKYINFGEVFNTTPADVYGDYLNISSNSTGARYGSYHLISGINGNNVYGNYNRLLNNGSGEKIGLYNEITGTGYSSFNGTLNAINAGNQTTNIYGTRNLISGFGDNVGIENSVSNNSSNSFTQVGVQNTLYGTNNGINVAIWNTLNSTGNGGHVGVSNNISGSGTGIKQGIRNNFSSTSFGEKYGLFNYFASTTNTLNTGIRNEFISNNNNNQYGIYNQFNSSFGPTYGEYSLFNGAGNSVRYGTYLNFLGSGNGDWVGYSANFDNITTSSTTGNKYGVAVNIPLGVGGGNHFGIYSHAGNLTNGYAGYFSGRVSIGDTTLNTDHYILPLTRGTAGQVMQTDGAGNVNWVNPSGLDDGDWSVNGNNVYKNNGYVSIGDSTNPHPLYVYDNNGNSIYATSISRNFSGTSQTRTLNLFCLNNSTSSSLSYGVYNSVLKPTSTLNTGDVIADFNTGSNYYNGTSLSRSYGSYNTSYKYNGTNGISYGSYNYAYNQSGTGSYGLYASFGGGTTSYAGFFAGNVYTTGTYLPSASILKYNVKEANTSLPKLSALKVKEYQYKTEELPFMNLPKGNQTGFIAEEMELLFPELVTKAIHPESDDELVKKGLEIPHDNIEYKAVNYTGLVPHLVKAIQEQQTEIEKLKEDNKALKEKIDYILNKINQ
ncbi:tail fiber domain-containing protein [Flavobacterium piscinae]|uniref:tail fiber domain-containing protein n=1 Tax=Flavobacterium piscinae TaxID=2506424 RepID=UPI0019AB120F|nr:tail fiber domain-containing protein [Flavobacterium piscinae]MBC8883156.1 tail fiber domain-containing protein [Flavobacterium piscinae]